MNFDLSEYSANFHQSDKWSYTISSPEDKLANITDILALASDAVATSEDNFDTINDLCLAYPSLLVSSQKQLVDLVHSSIKHQVENTSHIIEISDTESFNVHKKIIEIYVYLLNVLISHLDNEDISGYFTGPGAAGRKPTAQIVEQFKNNCYQVESCIDAGCSMLKLKLNRLIETTPEEDLFISLLTRPVYSLMESEQRMKVQSVKLYMFKLIALAVKYHHHTSVAQAAIIQNLTYFTHLNHAMAELLHLIAEKYDYPQLVEETLLEVSNKQFNTNDNNGPKSISQFIIKLSELSPKLVLKQMMSISKLLDNNAFSLRCSVIEACGNIIINICSNEADLERYQSQTDTLLDLVQDRFLDQNPFVRTKAVQALIKVAELNVKFVSRRQTFIELTVRSLDDKSSLVRRNSIKLMSKLIVSHPFGMLHGTSLHLSAWEKRLIEANNKLEMIENDLSNDKENQSQLDQDDREDDEEQHNKRNTYYKIKLTIKYYDEAISFIKCVTKGAIRAAKLLHSRNKNEVLEAMDFFVLADAYKISEAKLGIKRMLHLVWMKGTNDDGTAITNHLLECYKELFLIAPLDASALEAAVYIAKNLISLTYQTSVSDLASLEKLLSLMYEDQLIDNVVVKILWQIYNDSPSNSKEHEKRKNKNVLNLSAKQKRGAIIILGMISLANHEVALRYIDSMLNVGLRTSKLEDVVLAKYTCIALQRVIPADKMIQNSKNSEFKLLKEKEALTKISNCLVEYNDDPEWYPFAEQAINSIYVIASRPDEVCSNILRSKIQNVFFSQNQESDISPEKIDQDGDVDMEENSAKAADLFSDKENQWNSNTIGLSQLFFMVGHVAIKTMVHLEKCEAEFKKMKIEQETEKAKQKKKKKSGNSATGDNEKDELEMIGGTSEDDFADAVAYIKETELLYGENSLLAKFGPLAREVCSNNIKYDNLVLQRSAVLCMEKLMCISSKYCEDNLSLLITLMEKSQDAVIRSNAVLGLGDMAVCFNNLVDENTDYLYRRLNDSNIMVQRTCLMTVTFLILAGQVKVKGQLATMAKCLENADHGISDMCRLFFTELATKDNAIYNGFIDIFSGLSNDSLLPKDSMKRILRFLIGFIEKEKQQKSLSDKLLTRLNKATKEAEWKDVAFVLQTIPVKNEKVTTAIQAGYKLFNIKH